jgi:hypothetical protein
LGSSPTSHTRETIDLRQPVATRMTRTNSSPESIALVPQVGINSQAMYTSYLCKGQ